MTCPVAHFLRKVPEKYTPCSEVKIFYWEMARLVTHHSHVDCPLGKGLVAQDRSIFVFLPPLEHHEEPVLLPLEEVGVLGKKEKAESVPHHRSNQN